MSLPPPLGYRKRSQRLCRIAGEGLDVFRRVMEAQWALKPHLEPICVDQGQKLGCTKMSLKRVLQNINRMRVCSRGEM